MELHLCEDLHYSRAGCDSKCVQQSTGSSILPRSLPHSAVPLRQEVHFPRLLSVCVTTPIKVECAGEEQACDTDIH